MSIKERIEKYLNLEEEEEYYSIKPNEFHASECGKCPRQIYFDKTEPVAPNIESKKNFAVGNIFHEYIQYNILKEYTIEDQIKGIIEDLIIVGRIDAHDDKEIIELKSSSNAKAIQRPYQDHIIQINIYMHFTGIHRGRIVYINKNNLDITEFVIHYNKLLFESTINKIKYLNQKIKERVDPMTISPDISPLCSYCNYKKKCFKREW